MVNAGTLRRLARYVRSVAEATTEVGALPPDDHRPWPVPAEPWIMAQTWQDLLFAHWPVSPAALRARLPAGLELEMFDGRGWLGITPFILRNLRPRTLPPMPGVSTFPELNVRTYVRAGDKPGVFFFSLDAGSTLAVAAARSFYSLPYFRAVFAITRRDGIIDYRARRPRASGPPVAWEVAYRPTGPVMAEPGALARWLTERYCLYAVDGAGDLYRAEIHHAPWPLQAADAEIRRNSMTEGLGIRLPVEPPLVHFARRLDVHVWAPHPVREGAPASKPARPETRAG